LIALKITDTRDFMKKLLIENAFDAFVLTEASVTTFTTFHVDGTWHPDFYEDDPAGDAVSSHSSTAGDTLSVSGSAAPSCLTWKLVRPVFFAIIRGSHTPNHFRIILKLGEPSARAMLLRAGAGDAAKQTDALFLNLTYSGGNLSCTTGVSMKQFTMDKTADRLWDEAVQRFFQNHKIACEKQA